MLWSYACLPTLPRPTLIPYPHNSVSLKNMENSCFYKTYYVHIFPFPKTFHILPTPVCTQLHTTTEKQRQNNSNSIRKKRNYRYTYKNTVKTTKQEIKYGSNGIKKSSNQALWDRMSIKIPLCSCICLLLFGMRSALKCG